LSLEFIVGIMLVILGINVLITINKNKIHVHRHNHGKEEHIHFHSHKLIQNHGHAHISFNQSLFVGLIHGLAGSAAITLLILATIKSVLPGLIYILIFGAGSMIGMMLISSVISLPFILIPNKLERIQRFVRISAGSFSIIMGFSIIYVIGL